MFHTIKEVIEDLDHDELRSLQWELQYAYRWYIVAALITERQEQKVYDTDTLDELSDLKEGYLRKKHDISHSSLYQAVREEYAARDFTNMRVQYECWWQNPEMLNMTDLNKAIIIMAMSHLPFDTGVTNQAVESGERYLNNLGIFGILVENPDYHQVVLDCYRTGTQLKVPSWFPDSAIEAIRL